MKPHNLKPGSRVNIKFSLMGITKARLVAIEPGGTICIVKLTHPHHRFLKNGEHMRIHINLLAPRR